MTDEARAMWQKVLAHQLTGVMFHQEAALIYELLEDYPRESKRHHQHFLDEFLTHQKTARLIIRDYGEVVRPAFDTIKPVRISVPEITTRPNEPAERKKIACEIYAKWRTWEKSTVRLYEEAISVIPKYKWLKILKCNAGKEIKYIDSHANI